MVFVEESDYYPGHEPASWQTYSATTYYDGSIAVLVATNDDEDRGYPTTYAEWSETYPSREAFLKRVGGSHYGIGGARVDVWLDGERL